MSHCRDESDATVSHWGSFVICFMFVVGIAGGVAVTWADAYAKAHLPPPVCSCPGAPP
jgi:hypothetical protein